MANLTVTNCRNCGKKLGKGQRESHECAECTFHACNGTRTINKFNEWLRPGVKQMYYDLIVHDGKLHICGSPPSMTEMEVLDAFDLRGGIIIYGSDYAEEAEEIKRDLENDVRHEDDGSGVWHDLVDTYKKALEEQV